MTWLRSGLGSFVSDGSAAAECRHMWSFKKERSHFPELKEELLTLCQEWFAGQISDIPEDELPPHEEIELDAIQMRDRTYDRVLAAVPPRRFLDAAALPDDERNRRALSELTRAYVGHERTTPIFVHLAFSKLHEPLYQSGWPLCALRLIAETYLEQSTTPL